MKRLLVLFSMIVLLASCGNLHHRNFTKQKFTSLKKIKVSDEDKRPTNETYLAPVIASEDTLKGGCDTLYFKSGKTVTCTILKETDDVITFDNCPPTGGFYRVRKDKLIGYDKEIIEEEESIAEVEEIETEEVFVLDTLSQTDTTKSSVTYEDYKELTEDDNYKIESYNLLFGIGLSLFLIGVFTLWVVPAVGAVALVFSWIIALIMMGLGRKNKDMLSKNVKAFKLKNTLAWLWGLGPLIGLVLGVVIFLFVILAFL
ncbi:MAG: hypothetical protein MK078_00170 [Crocinitomicaceae bacterium]|nr:hypothetical protein [Crocinitomicaceae bacterium]